MSGQTDNLINLLKPYGLEEEEARIYLELLENKALTALKLSRNLEMGRTRVYRILDRLVEKELVTQQLDSGGYKFVASEPKQIGLLLEKKEAELEGLGRGLPQVVEMLEAKVDSGKSGSKILYYRGQEGLSRVNWNLLRAKEEFLSFEVANAEAYLPRSEAEKLRQEIVNKQIMVRTITNLAKFEPYTEVTALVKNWWQLRYVSEKELKIRADIFIYNDVYAVCNYLDGGDVFCFEIYNDNVVKMQREIFEELWKRARVMRMVSDQGEATI